MLKTCKICGLEKEAVQGIWVVSHGRPVGRVCLSCYSEASREKSREAKRKWLATPEGREKSREAMRKMVVDPNTGETITYGASLKRKLRATPEGGEKSREASREYCRKIRATPEGKEKRQEAMRKWSSTPGGRANNNRRSRARQDHIFKNACPPWADKQAIAKLYGEAKRLTEETGVSHVVDHVLPIKGRLVSGLHVHQNLRVTTWEENASKSNQFVIE